jgi:hypothetical protein
MSTALNFKNLDNAADAAAVKSSTIEEISRQGEEKSSSTSSSVQHYSSTDVIVTAQQCDNVLESMEECVGFCDGIDRQQIFEEGLKKQAAHQRQIAMDHGLSEAEASFIRLQMIDASAATDGIRSAVENTLSNSIITPQLDDILEQVCGISADAHNAIDPCRDIIDSTPLSTDLCDGIVLPMDTTLPTSQPLPGNDHVESKQGKSARSLVDVAAEDDAAIQEECDNDEDGENLTIDDGAIHECAICNDSSAVYDSAGGEITTSPSNITKDGTRKPIFCRLPCCESSTTNICNDDEEPQGGKNSNFKVCTACMLVLTVATKDGISRVGRCPRCREWISILTLHSTSASMVVRKLQNSGKCESCLQINTPLVVEDPPTCDACFLGKETSLTYECEECHQDQVIQSTLYRSQPSSKSFGNEMCPCNNCQKSTHWRIRYDQLPCIPANDVPEEWGDDFLELARTRVHTARQGIAKLDLLGRDAQGQKVKEESCMVM